ncbi:hypothetical protein I6J77_13680 [Rhodanobacter sp. FDAARGOS 1247]|uniref:hypothetical protein n=1 Tax=Rhodanobacter sp. FDAARGOS 1247 TaxID=2778082 RepID=UPI00194FA1E3|nr:hypothetical protein [Rhodanobacter sp. FDAARGOS 1247]QRP63157.1 hypothetical protein I6J77_13680 [Rhodanobacter sp. FDAARGOS 1247]
MLFLILLALATASPPNPVANEARQQIDCKAERVALLRSIKPVVNPEATLESKEDKDPNTVEFFYIKDLPTTQARVSEDGQVISIPLAMAEDTTVVAKLFATAIDRLLVLKIGAVCPSVQIPAAGT